MSTPTKIVISIGAFVVIELLCWHLYWLGGGYRGSETAAPAWALGHCIAVAASLAAFFNLPDKKP